MKPRCRRLTGEMGEKSDPWPSDMHLFVDISSHGFGHLAITAPALDALAEIAPELRLTVRSGLPRQKLAQRIARFAA